VREGKSEARVCLSTFHIGDVTGNHVKLYELVSGSCRAGAGGLGDGLGGRK
jgi:hypothetical protein